MIGSRGFLEMEGSRYNARKVLQANGVRDRP